MDDMRPSLGAYNFTLPGMPSHSPHIDTFAKEGLLFKRAYVQYAYCSPSRNSFMSGRRPDTTKVGFGCTLPLPAMVEHHAPPERLYIGHVIPNLSLTMLSLPPINPHRCGSSKTTFVRKVWGRTG